MPVLQNPKHERFAQALAKGGNATDAYAKAGYDVNPKTAAEAGSRLSRNVKVQRRVTELQEKSAERTVVTVSNITERLLAIAAKGETATDAPLLSVARAALMDAAKLNGLIVEKSLTAQTSVEDLLDQLDGKAG